MLHSHPMLSPLRFRWNCSPSIKEKKRKFLRTKMKKEKVFGIGLSRTGTTSLSEALTILGYKSWHFPGPLLTIDHGELRLNYNRIKYWDAINDTPISRFYRELDQLFPNSKFILTIRDTNEWLQSMKVLCRDPSENQEINQLHKDLYGNDTFDHVKFEKAYLNHLNSVIAYFKNRKNDLLVINICSGEGWEKLCHFLSTEVPNVPFPKKHVSINSILGKACSRSPL